MADRPPLTVETLDDWTREIVTTKVIPSDRQQVVDLVNALLVEMQPMRALAVGEHEPAIRYDAARSD